MKMHKLFLLISFTLLLIANIFGQAAVDLPLYATDGTYIIPLAFGLDLTATNGIDPQLGENDLPPFPPYGAFEIRFDLQPYTGEPLSSYKDYRNPSYFPYSGQLEHTLWWQVSSAALPIEIQYDLPVIQFMTLKDQLGGVFLNLGPFFGQGTVIIPGSYTNIFNRCLLIIEYNWIPVELTSFTASVLQNENAIQLNWTTATETNNSGFEIEKQVGSKQSAIGNWEKIGFVPGFGTTTEPKSYSFIDENVSTENYKYRLKQIDFDGSFTYSNEIEVEVDFTPEEFVLYQNYPNPFNPNTVISFQLPVNANVTLKVYDVVGNEVATLVNEEKQSGIYEVEFNASSISGYISAKGGYASGVYFYQLKAEGFVQTKKMILLR